MHVTEIVECRMLPFVTYRTAVGVGTLCTADCQHIHPWLHKYTQPPSYNVCTAVKTATKLHQILMQQRVHFLYLYILPKRSTCIETIWKCNTFLLVTNARCKGSIAHIHSHAHSLSLYYCAVFIYQHRRTNCPTHTHTLLQTCVYVYKIPYRSL